MRKHHHACLERQEKLANKITDFGEKIGGARKDLWAYRGLGIKDLTGMTDKERKKYTVKEFVWPRPDWSTLISEGTPQVVAYWQNEMRKALKSRPVTSSKEEEERYISFAGTLRDAVMAIETEDGIQSFFRDFFLARGYVKRRPAGGYLDVADSAKGILENKLLKAAQVYDVKRLTVMTDCILFGVPEEQRDYVLVKNKLHVILYDQSVTITKELYGERTVIKHSVPGGTSFYYMDNQFSNPGEWIAGSYFIVDSISRRPLQINIKSMEEAEAFVEAIARQIQEEKNAKQPEEAECKSRSGKKNFNIPRLEQFERTGPDYLHGGQATSYQYLNELKFRAGEFGHWVGDKERQINLDMAYQAFHDLAFALGIAVSDVSFDGILAIAFGSRGKGGSNAAAAHYEMDRKVINLTKMKGAGFTGHEWGHGLDDYIGHKCLENASDLSSELLKGNEDKLPKEFLEVIDALHWKNVIIDSKALEKERARNLKQAEELFKKILEGIRPLNMEDSQRRAWNKAEKALCHTDYKVTGHEYTNLWRNPTLIPEIERLSELRKKLKGHGIKKDKKHELALAVAAIISARNRAVPEAGESRRIKTEYYVGSMKFDSLYRKASHGYWCSNAELFARAFDCYLNDKLHAAGIKSEYLSAYADSFCIPDADGQIICAFPQGEERSRINEKFDALFDRLKANGWLRAASSDMK